MKTKTTIKAIRNNSGKILSIGYCGAQFLLRGHEPVAYTSGIYGWNFDVYEIDGVTICTGYRGMPGRRVDSLADVYDRKACEIVDDYKRPYKERAAEIEQLLHEFLEQA
jgi:hypothetical protein